MPQEGAPLLFQSRTPQCRSKSHKVIPTTPGGVAGQLSSLGLHLSSRINRKPQQMVFKERTGGSYRRVDMTLKSWV